jgi:hypothetical protein
MKARTNLAVAFEPRRVAAGFGGIPQRYRAVCCAELHYTLVYFLYLSVSCKTDSVAVTFGIGLENIK